jgi:hypothetical protein
MSLEIRDSSRFASLGMTRRLEEVFVGISKRSDAL